MPDGLGWRLAGTRPANYPPRRLAGLAYFLAENLPKGLFVQLLHPIEALTKTSVKDSTSHFSAISRAYQKLFCGNPSDYWVYRLTLGGKALANPIKLIGPEKVHQIIINLIIPLGLLYARHNQDEELEKGLFNIYKTAPKTSDNSIIRFMANRIFDSDHERRALINSARRQQALLQLFYDYCAEMGGDCEGCKFFSLITTTILNYYD